jgi:fructan beta-fructosidase
MQKISPDNTVYNEPYRPQFHFTYKKGWTSDVNGLFYYQGEYHFFSQHNPAGPSCDYSNIHWGHAVSRDLVHWTELPLALTPDADGSIFSGSAVVDWNNTSGLQTGIDPPIILFYTAARYILPSDGDGIQCMAYSNDRGRTWTKYAGNPVVNAITHYNRDPKVFWHEPTRRWIMVITLSCTNWLDGDHRFALFSSPDLKTWKELSRFEMPRGIDCPDMFELPVDGDPKNTRWVVWAGDGTYMIGTFNGQTVQREGEIHLPLTWEEDGANGYAAQTFSDIPASDGRRIQMAWFRHGQYPDMPFNQQATFPCELTLRTTPQGIRLFREPIREIDLLHGQRWHWEKQRLRSGENLLSDVQGELFEIRAKIESLQTSEICFKIRNITLHYDPAEKTLSCLGKKISAGSDDGKLRLQLLIDRNTVEIFADQGRTSLSFNVPPDKDRTPLGLGVEGGDAEIDSLTVWEMISIWTPELPGRQNTVSLAKSPFIFGAGGIGASMDTMPFFHDGQWHLFHMQTNPRGLAHRVGRDLVNWEIRPLAIPGNVATGSVVPHDGRFYFFYTATAEQTVHLAISDNLDDWTPYDHNPVAAVDGAYYVGENFRDPYVFYNDAESCWWMLVAAETPGPVRFRAGCVGVFTSKNLLDWHAAEPLWAPGSGPRQECPQVIRHAGRWYLFTLVRETQYRVAESLHGPWLRPPTPCVSPHTVLAGSRLASDGHRWISFPFMCALENNQDFSDVVQAEVYALPRQLDFQADGSITERAIPEVIEALQAQPSVEPLADAMIVSGSWKLESNNARCSGPSGALLLKNIPHDLYFEADVTLSTADMEVSVLLRADAEITRGYKLSLQPRDGWVSFRSFSYWDRDPVLIARPVVLPINRSFKLQIVLSGTVMEAFINDRVSLSSRVYKYTQGALALEGVDGGVIFENILIRRLAGDNHEADRDPK